MKEVTPTFLYYLDAVFYCTKHGITHASIVKHGKLWTVPNPVRHPMAQAHPPATPPEKKDGPV